MNKLIATLALGTTLAFGLVTVNALAKEGSESHSEHSGKSESTHSNSGSSANSGSSHVEDEANETEDHGTVGGTSGSGEQEAENEIGDDDAPPVLPALKPIGADVLLPLLSKKHHGGDVKTIY